MSRNRSNVKFCKRFQQYYQKGMCDMGNTLDVIVIALYFIAVLGLGYLGLRLNRGAEDFLVAGRRLGPFTFMSSMSATVLGGISTIGGASLGYQYGISGAVLVFMYSLAIIVMGVVFSSRLSRLGVYTLSETLGLRYGTYSKRFSAITSTFYLIMVAVSQLLAIGTILHVLFDLSPTISILIGWCVIMLYSGAGGMLALTYTDVLMFCVMTIGVLFLLVPSGLIDVGGLAQMKEVLPASYFSPIGIGVSTIVAYFFIFFFGLLVDQSLWQRTFTARSERVGRWGAVASGIYCMIYGVGAAFAGAIAKVKYPNLENPDTAFATLSMDVLPSGLTGIVFAAALAAIMSTASAMFVGSSTTITNDLYHDFTRQKYDKIKMNRIFLVLVGIVVLIISFAASSVVGAVTIAGNILVSSIFFPIVGAVFWDRATTPGALSAIIVGTAVTITLMITHGLYANEPVIYGIITNLVVFVVVSLLTPPPPKEQIEEWNRKMMEKKPNFSSQTSSTN